MRWLSSDRAYASGIGIPGFGSLFRVIPNISKLEVMAFLPVALGFIGVIMCRPVRFESVMCLINRKEIRKAEVLGLLPKISAQSKTLVEASG